MTKTLLFILSLACSRLLLSQASWLPTNSPSGSRYEDISFISPDTGWAVVNGVGSGGQIYRTNNGGQTWTAQKMINNYIRSIEFADKNVGFAGALSTSAQNVFLKTTDGGQTWTDISGVITGTNRGICGICCVNTSITYAVGVWSSPAYVMKTSDGGGTWQQLDMSAYASRLIDVQFTDANNGYVSGQSNITSEGAVILKTTDGGQSWSKVFTSNVAGEKVWKLQNLDGQHWYGSVEASVATYNDTVNNVFIKSSDGGNTWVTKPVGYANYLQGIGFIDTQRGWTGNTELFETNDGGDSWHKIMTGQPHTFNRFQKVNAGTSYLSSTLVYKLSEGPNAIKETQGSYVKPRWLSVAPNPAKDRIRCRISIPGRTMYGISVFNEQQEIVWELVAEKDKGSYQVEVDRKLPTGIYYLYIMFNEHAECEKVILE